MVLKYSHVVGKAPGSDTDKFIERVEANCTICIQQSTAD